jgi:DNA polymerase-3 subunit epsilon
LEAEYSIVDLETTGLSPKEGDRVVEIAVVRVCGDGTPVSEWTTLVNPGQDVGATHIHEITNDDVAEAPSFGDIAGDFLDAIKGSILVAHNFQFDRSMLDAEFAQLGLVLPQTPSLCTMLLSQNVQPGSARRYLGALTKRAGVELVHSHHALDDARATAQLLIDQLRIACEEGTRALQDLGCDTTLQPVLPDLEVAGKAHLRA